MYSVRNGWYAWKRKKGRRWDRTWLGGFTRSDCCLRGSGYNGVLRFLGKRLSVFHQHENYGGVGGSRPEDIGPSSLGNVLTPCVWVFFSAQYSRKLRVDIGPTCPFNFRRAPWVWVSAANNNHSINQSVLTKFASAGLPKFIFQENYRCRFFSPLI